MPKKHIILPVVAAASISIAPFALANMSPILPSNNNNSGTTNAVKKGDKEITNAIKGGDTTITKAIKEVGDKVVALGFAGMTAFDQAMYQFDQNLLKSYNANTAGTIVNQNAANSATATNAYVKKSFQNIPNSFLSTAEDAIGASKIEKEIKNENSLINNLTLGVPASDTLYINQPTVIAAGYGSYSPAISHYYHSDVKYTVGPPKINDNNYFSIASILAPSAYSNKQLSAANTYLTYLSQSYQNPASKLKLSNLKNYINTLKPDEQSSALYNFVSSAAYKKYQLALRSYMANKSIAINNFEHLIAERTPSKKKVAGIYNSKGQEISNPSPMQVEQYQANHRIDNPAWIQSLQKMSSANLQRQIAVELAQVIKQNQQAHQDRERMLATLSAMQLEADQAEHMTLVTSSEKVNEDIASLTGANNSSSMSSTNNSTQNIRQEMKQNSKKQAKNQK